MPVMYEGVKPGNFEEATEIVAIGSYRDGAFHAEQLLVKCPSKYQGVDEDPSQARHRDLSAVRRLDRSRRHGEPASRR